jgi:hypothetical protein
MEAIALGMVEPSLPQIGGWPHGAMKLLMIHVVFQSEER